MCYTTVKGQHTDMHNISSVSTLIYSIFHLPVYVISVLHLVIHKRLLDACDVAGTDLDAEGQQGTNTQTLKCKLYQMIKKVRE